MRMPDDQYKYTPPINDARLYAPHQFQDFSNHSDVNGPNMNNENRNIYEQTSSLSSASSPSLFKLFQYSKFNNSQINGDLVQSRLNRNNNPGEEMTQEQQHMKQMYQRFSRQEQLLALKQSQVKKTSFSQMSRRSRSSCALTNPNGKFTSIDPLLRFFFLY